MAYVGTPLDTTNAFQSLAGKRFSGDGSTTDFTLDSSPNSTLDIEVFVGNVRQDPNSAYTVSGTTLAFTGAPPSGTNNIYVVHQAKSVGTIDVPSASVQSGSLNSAFFTGATDIGAAIADADLFLTDDGAGGTIRKTAASRLKTYVGDNTPAFQARATSNQDVSDATSTKMEFDTEDYDTDSAYDASNDQFTVPAGEGGKYFMYAKAKISGGTVNTLNSSVLLFRIGSNERYGLEFFGNGIVSGTVETVQASGLNITATLDLSAGDVVSVYGYSNVSSGQAQFQTGDNYSIYFGGFKLNGV